MPYTPVATIVTEPTDLGIQASTAAAEFRTLKLYLRDVVMATLAPRASPTFTGLATAINVQVNQPASTLGVRITSDAGVPRLVFRDRSINATTHTIGAILFDAYRDVSDPSYVAAIRCEGNTPAGNTGDLVFSTGGNASTGFPPDRVRINYLGGVSIAAPVPATGQVPLSVVNGDITQPTLLANTNNNLVNPYLRFRRSSVIDDGLIGSVGTVGALVLDSGAGDVVLRTESAAVRISTNGGTSSALVITTGGSAEMRTTSGKLGYGAGAGSSVTQLTGKFEAVSLNRPTGRIITAGTATVTGERPNFTFFNSLIEAGDVVLVNFRSTVGAGFFCDLEASRVQAGQCIIQYESLNNNTSTLEINFVVIKGSAS